MCVIIKGIANHWHTDITLWHHQDSHYWLQTLINTCLTVEFMLDASLMFWVNMPVADIQQFSNSCEDHGISAQCCVCDIYVKQC